MNRKRLEEINHELKQGNDFLVMDGITNYEQFGKSGKKILWIMKETNQSGGTHPDDLRDFHKNVKTYLKWRRTYRPIIKSTYGIIHNLDYEAIPKEEDISWILNEIAFINIKKTGGGSTSNWKSIAEHYAKNKEVILEQVECIDPDIIINCSGIFQVFTDLTQANYANPGRFYVAKSNKWIVVNAYHPNQRSINQVQYYNLIKDCIKSVQNV